MFLYVVCFIGACVVSVRLNEERIDQMVINLALCYFIANLMNIGPGFGAVCPSHNFAFFSDAGKWLLCFNMLVGRLEMFSALVLFYPSFWKA